jgi:hypothetical protein
LNLYLDSKQDSRSVQSTITRLCRQLYEQGIRSVGFEFGIGQIYNPIFFHDECSSTESTSNQSTSRPPIPGQPSSNKLTFNPQPIDLLPVDSNSLNVQRHKGHPTKSTLASQFHFPNEKRISHSEMASPRTKSNEGQSIHRSALPIHISPGLATKVHPYPNLDGKSMPNSTKSIDFVKSWITGLPQVDDIPIINNRDENVSSKRKRSTE